jgi:SOS-response transcriptional repressor LexA
MFRMAERFTEKQGQYLAFIHNYTVMFGWPPAEADLQRFFGTTPPTVHQMLRKLADRKLIRRTPGQARSIEVLVDPNEIPRLVRPKEPETGPREAIRNSLRVADRGMVASAPYAELCGNIRCRA